jgi:hypothetical protein
VAPVTRAWVKGEYKASDRTASLGATPETPPTRGAE